MNTSRAFAVAAAFAATAFIAFFSFAGHAQAAGCKDASSGGLTLAPADCKPVKKARLIRGIAYAPDNAPAAVKRVIAAANRIRLKPYIYGGGHTLSRRLQAGYDCSGSVSYALRAGGFISYPMPSGSFTNWKQPGAGKWITTYANGGHMYMIVAGLSFDTSNMSSSGGNRWSTSIRSSRGFSVRHPGGF
ncbi:MAG TPA: hypothetical protein PKA56_09225 [Solirubrobacterales bacterium]|nr:hypothetical protein [Solirubrobacterales bacterium]HMX71924.1 hypothetical protein [Solirubrobacterales bacterium]HNH86104.1 hypothetical protein [Solirubrobacterales bacterium]HNK35997.1 hypothetical protein [Solirubrobacterales bacterium]HNO97037.1 hypothetical protein [Solirubrobacterales bacterium]